VTPSHPIPCSMLDREPIAEPIAFFLEKREVSNHFACLARARAGGFPAFVGLPPGVGRGRADPGVVILCRFSVTPATARTKRRVMAVMARFSLGLP
jgi:hypothetical protein